MARSSDVSRVVLVGPASPAVLAEELSGQARATAASIRGLSGIPVTSLARGLLGAGCQVELVTLAPDVHDVVVLESGRLRVLVGPYRPRARDCAKDFYRSERRQLRHLLSGTDGELLHAHWTYEFALACERDPRPVVVTAHDCPPTVLRQIPSAYRAARTVVGCRTRLGIRHLSAVSPTLAARWRREMLYRAPIEVLPNIIEVPPAPETQQVPDPAAPVILEISEAPDARKNVERLVAGFAQVRSAEPAAELHLVGPGLDSQGPIAQWARMRGLADGIRFIGRVPWQELGQHLESATLFAHTSLDENHCLAVCEAMAYGVPVLAGAKAGGLPWTLDHGRAGLLVDVREPAAIGRGILSLLRDPARREELGTAGRRRVLTEWSRDRVTQAYLDWYARSRDAPRRTERRSSGGPARVTPPPAPSSAGPL